MPFAQGRLAEGKVEFFASVSQWNCSTHALAPSTNCAGVVNKQKQTSQQAGHLQSTKVMVLTRVHAAALPLSVFALSQILFGRHLGQAVILRTFGRLKRATELLHP